MSKGERISKFVQALEGGEAKTAGDIQSEVDSDQVAWELSCLLVGANASFVQDGGNVGMERARRAIRERLERIATRSAARLPTR